MGSLLVDRGVELHKVAALPRLPSTETPLSSKNVAIERFSALYEEVYDDLWQYCQRRSATSDQAVDVLSETMLVMWERLDDIPPGAGARPWLFGVARNQLRKRNEKSSRSSRLVERLKFEYETRRSVVEPDEQAAAFDVLNALGQLSEDDQELLRLTAWEGLSHKEIAQIFEITENAVAIRLHRARERFETIRAEESGE